MDDRTHKIVVSVLGVVALAVGAVLVVSGSRIHTAAADRMSARASDLARSQVELKEPPLKLIEANLPDRPEPPASLRFAALGRHLLAGGPGWAAVFDVETGRKVCEVAAPGLQACAVSGDGRYLVLAAAAPGRTAGPALTLHRVEGGKPVSSVDLEPGTTVTALDFVAGSTQVAALLSGTSLRLYDTADGKLARSAEHPLGPRAATRMVLSPLGDRVALWLPESRLLEVREVFTGATVCSWTSPAGSGDPTHFSFSPDAGRLVVATGRTVRVIGVPGAAPEAPPRPPGAPGSRDVLERPAIDRPCTHAWFIDGERALVADVRVAAEVSTAGAIHLSELAPEHGRPALREVGDAFVDTGLPLLVDMAPGGRELACVAPRHTLYFWSMHP
jgi:hypothetical protein